jgi:hypothetical protein
MECNHSNRLNRTAPSLFSVEVNFLTGIGNRQTTQQMNLIDRSYNSIDFDVVIDMFKNYFLKYFLTYNYMRYVRMTQTYSIMKISVYWHVTWCSSVKVYQTSSKILAPIFQTIRRHILDVAAEGGRVSYVDSYFLRKWKYKGLW